MISQAQVDAYRGTGCVLVENVVDAATIVEVKRVIEVLVAGAKDRTQHDDVYDLEPTHTPETPRVRRINPPVRVVMERKAWM